MDFFLNKEASATNSLFEEDLKNHFINDITDKSINKTNFSSIFPMS
jgi:hypothetical protein